MVRFLHIADLHLGMRITRFSQESIKKVRQARFHALENIREKVRRPDAGFQFVIVAGDLFDDVNVTADIARRAFEIFESFPVPVLVLPGNHDPLQAGSVWEIDPWRQTAAAGPQRVRVLRERTPCEVLPGVTVLPCPVFRKTSAEDPTAWIRTFPRAADSAIRIGIAHGSVMDRPNLPDDDHPIRPTAPDDLELDYLALGHWHNYKEYSDAAGRVRMVYTGVHEPMRFSGEGHSSGWRPYSSGGSRDEFLDRGPGSAVAVTISAPGAAPELEKLDVGYHKWTSREVRLHSTEELARLVDEISEARDKELTLLRLTLTGTLPIEALSRLDDLRNVLASYVVGELDDGQLTVEPTEEEIRTAIGTGVLGTVFERLRAQAVSPETNGQLVAERAIRLLYRLAREV